MRTFTHTIIDPVGIHARPASKLVKEAKEVDSTVTIEVNGKSADASKLIAIMSLGAKCGDEIIVNIEGGDEEATETKLKAFFADF